MYAMQRGVGHNAFSQFCASACACETVHLGFQFDFNAFSHRQLVDKACAAKIKAKETGYAHAKGKNGLENETKSQTKNAASGRGAAPQVSSAAAAGQVNKLGL